MSATNENLTKQTQLFDYTEPTCYCGGCKPVSVVSVLASLLATELLLLLVFLWPLRSQKQRNENSTHLTEYEPETFRKV